MVVGDTADNVNYCKGYGKSWFAKNCNVGDSQYVLIKTVYSLFKELYKGKARQRYVECNNLLKLRIDV